MQACLLAAVTTAARGERVEWLDTSTFFNAHHAAAFYHALPASPHVGCPLEASPYGCIHTWMNAIRSLILHRFQGQLHCSPARNPSIFIKDCRSGFSLQVA